MSSPTVSARMNCWRSPPPWNANQSIRSLRLSRVVPTSRSTKLAATAFRNVPGHGAQAQVDGQRVDRQPPPDDRPRLDLGDLGRRRDELAAAGRTAVLVAVDGRVAGVLAFADAPRHRGSSIRELHAMNIQVVMLTGDNEATARRIADQLGIDTVIAEVRPRNRPRSRSSARRKTRRHGRRRRQ